MNARIAAVIIGLCLTCSCVVAGVTPPAELDFNYPPPPAEGEADFFTIAADSEAKAAIVLAEGRTSEELRAARNLKLYLEESTGASFTIVTEEDEIPHGLGTIHVGDTSVGQTVDLHLPPVYYSDLQMPNVNGFLVKTLDPETLVIRGATPQATVLGAVTFLRRYVGVRRYWPGPPGGIGDVVPEHESLSIPDVEWRDWPYYISRIMSGLDNRGPRTDEGRSVRFADFWRMNYTIPSNESYYKLMKTREHLDEPELFPLIDGERYVPDVKPGERIPHGWQPCVSNPKVADIMTQTLLETFEHNPEKIAMNLCVNDGAGDCQCEDCRAMDAPGADPINRIGLCDRYVKFDNTVAERVAEQYPNKLLAFIAYGPMRHPPQTVTLHPNLMPVLCVWGNAFEMWDEWMATDPKHMGVYLYHDDLRYILPKLDIHQSAKRLDYITGSGLARHFYQEFYGIYPLDGMVGYVEAELIWDPRRDVDAMLQEYYDGFFGPAAEPMERFYSELESGYEAWLEEDGLPHPYGKDHTSIFESKSIEQFSVLPAENMENAQDALDEALDTAEDDVLVTRRIELVKTLFDFAVPGVKMYWAYDRLRDSEIEVDEAQQVLEDGRTAVRYNLALADYKYDVMEKPPASEYASHSTSAQVYQDLQKNQVHPQIVNAIARAFRTLGATMGDEWGPEAARAWWNEHARDVDPSIIADLMTMARFHASGQALENLIDDPGFEQRGASQTPAAGTDLPANHQTYDGANVWCGRGSPMKCSLTTDDAHSGKYSFTFFQTQHAGVSEGISVDGGELLSMSLWVKHNDAPGRYKVSVLPRSSEGMLARTTVDVPDKPDEWQHIEIPFITPPEARTVRIYLFVDDQAPEAKVYVDDFFIGQYPRQ